MGAEELMANCLIDENIYIVGCASGLMAWRVFLVHSVLVCSDLDGTFIFLIALRRFVFSYRSIRPRRIIQMAADFHDFAIDI